MTDNEKYYDEEIAPLLAKAGDMCINKGMSMVCAVEYDDEEVGETTVLQPDSGLKIAMTHLCVKTAPNVDGYIIGLKRYCRENDIGMSSSIYLSKP